MNCYPREILHQICSLLNFDDVASFRRVSHLFADIGAEHLITKIYFHCSEESLQRFNDLAKHAVFSQTITTIVFEAITLAEMGCEHAYAAHFDSAHHRAERPESPSSDCTPRERRLYDRNLSKFNLEVQNKYQRYQSAFTAQQKILGSKEYLRLINTNIKAFSNLQHVKLCTVGRCKHSLSRRFVSSFGVDCAMPMSSDTTRSISQFHALLFPNGTSFTGLKKLEAHLLSPWFFNMESKSGLFKVFKSLQWVELTFRLEDENRVDLDMGIDFCYNGLSEGILCKTLSAAQDLRHLTINFNDYGFFGSVVNVKHVLGQKVWPLLTDLDIDCMCAADDTFVEALKRQPNLKNLKIAYFTLTKGRWEDLITLMRKELKLQSFFATGILQDDEMMYDTDQVDEEAYITDFMIMSMTSLLDMYVTDGWVEPLGDGDEEPFNPLKFVTFSDLDDLREEYGGPSDSEYESEPDLDDSEMDCDSGGVSLLQNH